MRSSLGCSIIKQLKNKDYGKTLALTFLLAINSHSVQLLQQNDPNINQVVVSSVYEDGITIINWESNYINTVTI